MGSDGLSTDDFSNSVEPVYTTSNLGDLRQVPQNVEAEQAVLGAILFRTKSDEAMIEAASLLQAKDFYRQSHQQIYAAMQSLVEQNRPIDFHILVDELSRLNQLDNVGGQDYLAAIIQSQATAANLRYYAQIVREKSILRQLIDALTKSVTSAYDERDQSDQIVEQLGRQLDAIIEGQNDDDFQLVGDVAHAVLDDIDEKAKNPVDDDITGIKSGLLDFDKVTRGFKSGQMVVIGARPGMGKTAFALNTLRVAAVQEKIPVVIYSMEMDAKSIVIRLLASQAHIDAKHLESGQLTETEWGFLTQAVKELSKSQIYISESTDVRTNTMRAQLKKLERELLGKMTKEAQQANPHPIGMVMVDYLQLMESTNRESRQQAVSENSRHIKKMAMELGTTILALTQLNRAVEQGNGRRPNLSDIRESGSIEQDADIVAFLHRDDYRLSKGEDDDAEIQEEQPTSQMDIIVEKNRAGERATVTVMFNKPLYRFDPLEKRYNDMDMPSNWQDGKNTPQVPADQW